MKKRITAVLIAVTVLTALCGCGKNGIRTDDNNEETTAGVSAEEIIITDLIGRTVSIVPGSYERVVCIGAGALRMYSYVGDTALLCGVEDIDNETLENRPKMFDSVARPYVLAYGDVFSTLPSCGTGGPQAQAAEAERILMCNPDIVISEYEDVEKEDALQEQLGVPVITLKAGYNGVLDQAFTDSMKLLGQVFGREERAAELTTFIQKETGEIRTRTTDISEEDKPSVYICGLGNWGTTDYLYTAQDYAYFELANVKNAVSGLGKSGIQQIEKEKFESLGDSIDIMIMDAAAVKNIIPELSEDSSIFDSCRAWNSGEVYLQMAYNAYYTNYEIALANAWFIAKTVYPDRFDDIDMSAKTGEITEQFLGMDLAEKIYSCPSSFGGYQRIDTAELFG